MSDDRRGPRDERDSEPNTLAVGSPLDRLTAPIDDEGGELATAVADARVLRAMIEKAQANAGTQEEEKHNSDAPTQMRDRDELMSELPTRPPPAMPLPKIDADDDNSERTVATDSPEVLQDGGSSPVLSDLQMARELMRKQMEAEAKGQPAPPPTPSSDRLPQSARVSLPGVTPDDIDPYEATIARPPPEAPSSDRAPNAPIPSQRGTSPLAGTGYVPAGAAPQASPFAQTAYQQHAPTQPVAFPVPGLPAPHAPAFPPPQQPQPAPSQRMGPAPMHQQNHPGMPPHQMMQQPMPPQPMQLGQGMDPGHSTNPGGPFAPPAPPIMQFSRAPAQQTNRVQILVIVACGVIAAVGLVLILVALRR